MEWDGLALKDGLKLLENCYNQIAQLVKAEQTDPHKIALLVDEAEQIVVLLTSILPKTPLEEAAEDLEAVKVKADALVELLQTEMETIAQQFAQISTGRQAMNAYNPQPVGFGYSEESLYCKK